MFSLKLGLQFIITGMVIVFITLIIMCISMWLVGLIVKEKKKEKRNSENFTENEIIALSLAVYQYEYEKEGLALEFEQVPNWRIRGRIESLEQIQ
jgi:Na+-transporting methylmalonyl-CoA/oxaloacetate decarboxylase gamma subunit